MDRMEKAFAKMSRDFESFNQKLERFFAGQFAPYAEGDEAEDNDKCSRADSILKRLDRLERFFSRGSGSMVLGNDIVPAVNGAYSLGRPEWQLRNVDTKMINGRPVEDYLDTDNRNYQFEADIEDRVNRIERMLDLNGANLRC